MISLICTKCRATLTIDEAFAGGVCRCQHCGTIQTVPARLRSAGASSGTVAQAADTAGAKALHQDKRTAQQGSGLEELGEIIASSGLSSTRLRQPMRTSIEATPPPQRPATKLSPTLAGGLAAGVLGLLLVLWLMFGRGGDGTPTPTGTGRGPTVAGAPTVTGPNFAGIPLSGRTTVYILDRGAASRESLSEVKEATLRSIESLGSDRRFRIIFWDTGSLETFPAADPVNATPENLASAREAIANITAWGASDARPALEAAARNRPDEIVLVTAKGWDLDESFVTMVKSALGTAQPTVHTLSVGEPSPPLQAIANESGGQALALTVGELRVTGK